MSDEAVAALQEIVSLLRRRVEQHDEDVRRAQDVQRQTMERLAEINTGREPDVRRAREESRRKIEEMERRSEEAAKVGEQRMKEMKQEQERRYEDEREFRRRLLAELERHNSLLEQLLAVRAGADLPPAGPGRG
jgi:hypothetical protein